MSLILQGIDLPEGDTIEVIIRIQPNGEVRDSHGILLTEVKAIRIDRPHGRLGDLDKVLKGLEVDTREAFTKHDVWLMLSKYNVPTILEAEENR